MLMKAIFLEDSYQKEFDANVEMAEDKCRDGRG